MASDPPLSKSDTIFALAYAGAVKSAFQINLGPHDILLTSPVTERGIPAGDLIYPQMTNYLIYKFADALQFSDNPSFTGGLAGSYIQQLNSYINWVKTRSNPSQVAAARMATARSNYEEADANYWKVYKTAKDLFKDVKDDFPNQTFWQWASNNYRQLGVADTTRASAESELYQAMQQYFGPDASTLSGYMDRIKDARSPNPLPGYNQDGLVDDQDLIADAIKYANTGTKPPAIGDQVKQSTIRVPLYSIATYTSGVQAWITDSGHGATRDQKITIDVAQGSSTSWSDYGFKEVNAKASAGFWPFFYTEVTVNNRKETRTLDTTDQESGVKIELSMIGIQKFDIKAGEWDVAGIKTLFPNRLPDAPDVLSTKFARVVSVLVGYDVELKIKFSSTYTKKVSEMYDEVKQTKGKMSVFGFWVSAGGSGDSTDRVHTDFNDVKWSSDSGELILTPTKGQVYPTILGVLAQRFDS